MGVDGSTRILPSCSETNLIWVPCTTDSSFKIPSHASGNSEVIFRSSFLRRTRVDSTSLCSCTPDTFLHMLLTRLDSGGKVKFLRGDRLALCEENIKVCLIVSGCRDTAV